MGEADADHVRGVSMKAGNRTRGLGGAPSHVASAIDAEICAPDPVGLALQMISRINPQNTTERQLRRLSLKVLATRPIPQPKRIPRKASIVKNQKSRRSGNERSNLAPDGRCSRGRRGEPGAQTIVPTRAALAKVEKDHPDESDAQKWRLAQAQTLIDSFMDSPGE